MSIKKELLEYCEWILKGNKPAYLRVGLCQNFNDAYDDAYRAIINLSKTWDKFSGKLFYPVPHPTLDPEIAFFSDLNKWDKRTTYGKNRYELVAHIRDELKKELNQ